MAMKNTITQLRIMNSHDSANQGFALLVAVIFMAVMLTFGLALGSLAFKQSKLTGTAIESQYAFYAADSALECVLYADQQLDSFNFNNFVKNQKDPSITCDGSSTATSVTVAGGAQLIATARLSLDGGIHCADVSIYKPKSSTGTTYLFSQGYNVSCQTVAAGSSAIVARGLEAQY